MLQCRAVGARIGARRAASRPGGGGGSRPGSARSAARSRSASGTGESEAIDRPSWARWGLGSEQGRGARTRGPSGRGPPASRPAIDEMMIIGRTDRTAARNPGHCAPAAADTPSLVPKVAGLHAYAKTVPQVRRDAPSSRRPSWKRRRIGNGVPKASRELASHLDDSLRRGLAWGGATDMQVATGVIEAELDRPVIGGEPICTSSAARTYGCSRL